jgi:hypothetical protein
MPLSKNVRRPVAELGWADVGRPRKNPESEETILSFRVNAELRDKLDEVVARANAEQPGRSMSRTELIKIVLYDWLNRSAKVPKKK